MEDWCIHCKALHLCECAKGHTDGSAGLEPAHSAQTVNESSEILQEKLTSLKSTDNNAMEQSSDVTENTDDVPTSTTSMHQGTSLAAVLDHSQLGQSNTFSLQQNPGAAREEVLTGSSDADDTEDESNTSPSPQSSNADDDDKDELASSTSVELPEVDDEDDDSSSSWSIDTATYHEELRQFHLRFGFQEEEDADEEISDDHESHSSNTSGAINPLQDIEGDNHLAIADRFEDDLELFWLLFYFTMKEPDSSQIPERIQDLDIEERRAWTLIRNMFESCGAAVTETVEDCIKWTLRETGCWHIRSAIIQSFGEVDYDTELAAFFIKELQLAADYLQDLQEYRRARQ